MIKLTEYCFFGFKSQMLKVPSMRDTGLVTIPQSILQWFISKYRSLCQ